MSLIYAIRLHKNSRKFIESAVDYASEQWSPELTLAAIHLSAGLELILKARLAMEDHHQILGRRAKGISP